MNLLNAVSGRTPDIESTVPWCLHEALERDLPSWPLTITSSASATTHRSEHRPHHAGANISVHSWPQSWSSFEATKLPCLMTTVVIDEDQRAAAVYVAKKLRGVVEVDAAFWDRLHARTIIDRDGLHGNEWIDLGDDIGDIDISDSDDSHIPAAGYGMGDW